MRRIRIAGAVLLGAVAAACVPRAAPPVPAPIRPAPRPLPPPPDPVPQRPPANWQDGPLSPGDWAYLRDGAVPLAVFRSERMTLSLRCAPNGSISVGLTGAQAPTFSVRTSYGERRLAATPVHFNEMIATLPAADPLLDQMAFSRGRFLIQAEGGPALVVPAWPELARVTEDCRG